jgi:hypothetical protein
MRYLKSVIVGIVAAVICTVIWVVAVLVLPILLPFLISRFTGSGGVGAASVGSGSIFAAALVGFVAGFFWKFTRVSRPGAHPR